MALQTFSLALLGVLGPALFLASLSKLFDCFPNAGLLRRLGLSKLVFRKKVVEVEERVKESQRMAENC